MLQITNGVEFNCSVMVQFFSSSGLSATNQNLKNVLVTLERNEYQELVLRIHDAKAPRNFILRDIQLFTRFMKSGKCTVKILPDNVQVLISDCPPDRLAMFLKTLSLKHLAWKSDKSVTERMKFLERRPRSFVAISPIQQKDVQRARDLDRQNSKQAEGRLDIHQQKKRPRDQDNHASHHIQPRKKPTLTLSSGRTLSKEQTTVLGAVLSGRNVFFTGSAGTGKSFLLRRIIGSLPPKSTFATASTGVAACHIGGTTLHSFAGIGSGSAPLDQCLQLAQRPGALQNWLSCKHLIIDEISMVHAEFFDKLEAVARSVRRSQEPFGGIQLIVCGDFFQLPPVCKGKDKASFCFQARSWRKTIQVTMELSQVRRQTDKTFISLLQAVRVGRVTEDITKRLMDSAGNNIERDGIVATRLCTHKDDVEMTNENKLKQLPGPLHQFDAVDSNPNLVPTVDIQSHIQNSLQLKVGAQVMLTKNLDVQRGLVNGARGVVLGFQSDQQGLPKVQFLCGVSEVIRRERWVFKASGGQLVSRQQLPLKLAWAISIHKSQGMTLDCVEISLARVFESGQAYVALSRAKSLEGLRLLDFNPHVVNANQDVLQFYKRLRNEVHMFSKPPMREC